MNSTFYWGRFFTIGGWFTWVAAGITVVTAVGGAVAANQQQKKAAKQAEQLAGQQQGMYGKNLFKPPTLPNYIPFDFGGAQKKAIQADTEFYQRSDVDFKRRHAPLVEAEKIFEARTLADQKGEHELMPQLQSEIMRAGIGGSLEAFGDGALGGGSLAPGSAGEANVARNLGVGVMAFQDRNRANRERSLSIAEDLFPRRTFGMGGADLVSHLSSDTTNRNAFNSAQYERQFAAEQAKVGQQANVNNAMAQSQNAAAAAKAEADAARTAAIVNAATTALQAGAKAYGQYSAGSSGATSLSSAVSPNWQSNASGGRYGSSVGGTWKPVGTYA